MKQKIKIDERLGAHMMEGSPPIYSQPNAWRRTKEKNLARFAQAVYDLRLYFIKAVFGNGPASQNPQIRLREPSSSIWVGAPNCSVQLHNFRMGWEPIRLFSARFGRSNSAHRNKS